MSNHGGVLLRKIASSSPHLAKRHRWQLVSPQAFWIVNLVAVAIACLWTFLDAGLTIAIDDVHQPADLFHDGRTVGMATLVGISAASLLALIVGLVVGARPFRTLKSLMVLVTLVGVSMGVSVRYSDVAFQGKRFRLQSQLDTVEAIADSLRQQWPSCDGQRPGLGPFMAYPAGSPRTLLLLTPPTISSDRVSSTAGTRLSAVEKSTKGAIRFELSGIERGDWLEWHPPSSTPHSYVGGLQNHYVLERASSLRDGWFLVRYKAQSR